jgi:hypothetical protein
MTVSTTTTVSTTVTVSGVGAAPQADISARIIIEAASKMARNKDILFILLILPDKYLEI